MWWIPVGVWIGAAVLAAVVLGYCAYELSWKARRLRADLADLQGTAGQLAAVQTGLAAVQQRMAAVQQRAGFEGPMRPAPSRTS